MRTPDGSFPAPAAPAPWIQRRPGLELALLPLEVLANPLLPADLDGEPVQQMHEIVCSPKASALGKPLLSESLVLSEGLVRQLHLDTAAAVNAGTPTGRMLRAARILARAGSSDTPLIPSTSAACVLSAETMRIKRSG